MLCIPGANFVDECQQRNFCEQKCVDTWDSYYCACNAGYELIPEPINCPVFGGRKFTFSNGRVIVIMFKSVMLYLAPTLLLIT